VPGTLSPHNSIEAASSPAFERIDCATNSDNTFVGREAGIESLFWTNLCAISQAIRTAAGIASRSRVWTLPADIYNARTESSHR